MKTINTKENVLSCLWLSSNPVKKEEKKDISTILQSLVTVFAVCSFGFNPERD